MNLMNHRLFFGVVVAMAFMIIGTNASMPTHVSFGVMSLESVFKNQNSLDANDAVYNSNVSKSLGSKTFH